MNIMRIEIDWLSKQICCIIKRYTKASLNKDWLFLCQKTKNNNENPKKIMSCVKQINRDKDDKKTQKTNQTSEFTNKKIIRKIEIMNNTNTTYEYYYEENRYRLVI